jgi:translocator protein
MFQKNVRSFMHKDTVRQYANLLTVVLALGVNILATTLPLNGQNTGEISDRFRVYFVPAGYVFSIWGVIYMGWIAFTIFQFQTSQKESPRLRRMGYLFAISNIANAAWLFCWHYNLFGLSVLVMLALLALLITAYLRLNVNRSTVSGFEYGSVDLMFSVYLGWITVAAVANISVWLYFVGWDGFGIPAEVWAVIMLALASLLGLGMAIARRDVGYISVLVWAFIGIAVKQASAPLVVASAWIAVGLMAGLVVFSLIRQRNTYLS